MSASLSSTILAALLGVVVTLGISEVAFSSRRKLDPSSPWIAAWCAAVGLYLIGRTLETEHALELGARVRFLAAVPMAALGIGVVRARARRPLSPGALALLASGTITTMAITWWSPLRPMVALTGAAIVVIGVFSVTTLATAPALSRSRRLVSVAVVVVTGGTALNDILSQLGVIDSVHLVEFALAGLPLLHNFRLVRQMHDLNLSLDVAVTARTAELLARTRELETAVAETRVARDQAEASRSRLELAERLASLGTMAAGVAHEINNPLSFVLGNLSLLREELAANHEHAELVHDAIEGAIRVKHIVRDLKAFAATHDEDAELLDLDDAVDGALNLLGGPLRERASLERERAATPRVRAARMRIGQVLTHLIHNAAEALPAGKHHNRIRVSTGATPSGEAFVSVADNGRGIAPEVLPRIFEPFFTTKPIGAGTGLGLSICHGIARALGGRIEVHTQPGQGSTFTMVLPAAAPARLASSSPAPSAMASSPPASTAPAQPRRRVLVIDDDPMVARTLRRALKAHDVVVAPGGAEGLVCCRESSFDLILCDLMMPGMNGMDVYQALTTLGLSDRVVILTGGAFSEPTLQFLARPAVRHLDKPVDFALLDRFLHDPTGARC